MKYEQVWVYFSVFSLNIYLNSVIRLSSTPSSPILMALFKSSIEAIN